MKISPDGSRLALVLENRSPDVIDLFDFDISSGKVSNYLDLSFVGSQHGGFYGISFSSDNSKLYVNGSTGLFQFSLDAGDGSADAILQTKYAIPVLSHYSSGLQLGPDQKIYVIRNEYASVITEPNLPGPACNFVDNAIFLLGKNTLYSFPAFLDSFDYPNKDSFPLDIDLEEEITLCADESVVIDATSASDGISYRWHDGSTEPAYTVAPPVLTGWKFQMNFAPCGKI